MIKTIGTEKFENSKEFDSYKDFPVPFCFRFIFGVFLELFNHASTEGGFTWQDVYCYEMVRKINLSQCEIDYIMKCRTWANQEISKLRDEEEED